MSDQGFDFQQEPPRREARRFEPPPWEKDLFEQREREKAEAEAEAELEQQAREAAAETTVAAEEVPPQAEVSPVETEPEKPEKPAPKGELDQKQVELMLFELRAEEPDPLARTWVANIVAGAVLVLIGLSVGAWGAAALAKHLGATGTLGGMVMVVFGLAFVGIGGWLVLKGLRQRGVL